MADIRDNVRNTTVKQLLRMIDGLGEMVEERNARIEVQMVRSQSADMGSGFIKGGDVDDLKILLMNVASARQAINDGLDAIELVAKGAKTVHHDYEELIVSKYDNNAVDATV